MNPIRRQETIGSKEGRLGVRAKTQVSKLSIIFSDFFYLLKIQDNRSMAANTGKRS